MTFVPDWTHAASQEDGLFYDFIDRFENVRAVSDCRAMLHEIVREYGLSNAAYLGVNLPGVPRGQHFGIVTYSNEWVTRYLHMNYFKVDPVIPAAMRSLLPFDWANVDHNNLELRRFFGEASEFKVGLQGLSFPIRGRLGETALFSISSNLNDREWFMFRRRFMRDFQTFAFYFHEAVLKSESLLSENDIKLSRREIECLSWAAAGKTFGEIATILSLSERTVKFYLDVARVKLRSTNITQAVSKAVTMNVIRHY